MEINSPETYISDFCLIKSAGFKKESFTSGLQYVDVLAEFERVIAVTTLTSSVLMDLSSSGYDNCNPSPTSNGGLISINEVSPTFPL